MREKTWGGACGEDHPSHKVTAEQVLEMRRLYETTDCRFRDLAEKYGISIRSVSAIMDGSGWKSVTGGVPVSQEIRVLKQIHRHRKLSREDVIEIRRSYLEDADITQREIAERFGVSQSRVSMIVNRRSWQFVRKE